MCSRGPGGLKSKTRCQQSLPSKGARKDLFRPLSSFPQFLGSWQQHSRLRVAGCPFVRFCLCAQISPLLQGHSSALLTSL